MLYNAQTSILLVGKMYNAFHIIPQNPSWGPQFENRLMRQYVSGRILSVLNAAFKTSIRQKKIFQKTNQICILLSFCVFMLQAYSLILLRKDFQGFRSPSVA